MATNIKRFIIVSLVLLAPLKSYAAQCTTSELDLMCPSGQVLQGIKPDGKKICVAKAPVSQSVSIDYSQCRNVQHYTSWASCPSNYVVVAATFWNRGGGGGGESVRCCKLTVR